MSTRLGVELNALTHVPPGMWESHKRGKNWLAKIQRDPRSPGGLGREFFPRAYGDYYYLDIDKLKIGDVVEFGADYYSGGGNPSRKRWYGVVLSVSADELVLEQYETAAQAFKANQEGSNNE